MLIPIVTPFRRRRGRPKLQQVMPTPPGVPLTLVEAVYDDSVPLVRLEFERAIDIAALDGTQIVVNDVPENLRLVATGTSMLVDANTVEILLILDGIATGAGWNMTASSATGIVAVDDGGTWAGVTELELPFP